MALFKGKGLLKLVYPHDGSTDFMRKTDVMGISTMVEEDDDGFYLSIDVTLAGDAHLQSSGEMFDTWEDAANFCDDFSTELEKIIEADTEDNTDDTYLLIGIPDDEGDTDIDDEKSK